jgi:two-component system chemotaxis sensor kinase CheA
MMFDTNKFKDIFLLEAKEHLQKLNDNLLLLEKIFKDKKIENKLASSQSGELLNELMRSSHTVKSSSATMGFNKLAYLTHVLEDIFDYARYGKLTLDKKIFNFLYDIFDNIEKSLKEIKENNKELDLQELADKIKLVTGVATTGTGKSIKNQPDGQPLKVKSGEVKSDGFEKISHINVSVEKLDQLMNLTEELLIHRLRLNAYFKKITHSSDLDEINESLGFAISNLQYSVMQVRLVPVAEAFINFPRLVRDLSLKQNKDIEFEILGSDLELDRTIVDKLQDPVVHLLRNAIDHGIINHGKIKIVVKREKDYFAIEVEDSGQGIDWQKVVAVAFKRSIINQETANKFNKELEQKKNNIPSDEIVHLIFHPNLSTAEKITETSGRGVGLSVVENFIRDIHGNITVYSPLSENKGTKIILELPLTLAIIKSLLVKVQDQRFAIPFTVIERAVSVPQESIKSMGDQDIAVIDEIDVPLIRMEKIFGFLSSQTRNKDNLTIVLARRGLDLVGLVVDELINQQEIIVKSLPDYVKGVKGFAGSTILGDGQTVLILDIASIALDIKKLTRV